MDSVTSRVSPSVTAVDAEMHNDFTVTGEANVPYLMTCH